MPTSSPIAIKKEGTPTWLYNALRKLVDNSLQVDRSIGAVVRGETPDGSGNPLVDTTRFFVKPGLPGGQIAFGGTNSGELLTLSSTANSTKGFILFGTPTIRMTLDEVQGFFGIGTSTPAVMLHIVGNTSGSGTSLTTNSDIANNWAGPFTGGGTPIGGTSAAALSSNDGTTSYMAINTSIPNGTNNQKNGLSGTILPGKSYSITCSVFALGGTFTAGSIITFSLIDSSGNKYTSSNVSLTGISTTPTTITTTLTTTGIVGTGTANSIELNATGNTLYVCVSYVAVSTLGGDLVRWDNNLGTQLGKIDSNGRFGIGTGSMTLTPMISILTDGINTVGLSITPQAAQSADLITLFSSSNVAVSGYTAVGAPYLVTGKGVNKFLQSDANGVGSWIAQAALTKTDDTNVTLTLGGSPTIALTAAASLTLGWTGQLSIARGGTGQSTALAAFNALSPLTTRGDILTRDATNNIRVAIGASGSILSSNGTDPTWSATTALTLMVKDSLFTVVDDGDTTKKLQFQCSGITTATTRTLTIPDLSGTLVLAEQNAVISGSWVFTANGSGGVALRTGVTSGGSFTGIGLILDDGSGFLGEIDGPSTGWTANRWFAFPDASGTVLLSGAVNNLHANTGSIFDVNTATAGAAFADVTNPNKKLRIILSTSVSGNNTFTISNTAARDYKFENVPGTVTIMGNGANPPASGAMGRVDLTAQGAAIAATNLTNTTPAGYYAIDYTIEDTTADVTAGTIQFQISYTDDIGATTQTGAALVLTATGRDRGRLQVYLASGNITYQTNLVGGIGTAKYALRVRCSFLG